MARSGLVLAVLLIAGLAAVCSSPVPTVLGQGGGQFSPRTAEDDLSVIYLPLVELDDRRGDWENLLDEDFEGTFPYEKWVVVDQNEEDGEFYWAKRDCRAASGVYSAWPVGGGQQGKDYPCFRDYPDHVFSWMTYGPIDLRDATMAELRFKRWLNTTGEEDSLQYLASVDNNHYEGFKLFGSSQEWRETVFDLTQVPVLGSLVGEPQVWIRFVFETKNADSREEGAYVDDIILRKWVPDQSQAP
jgi:hypothetical protein